jgi:endonuclease/exonuclease/phosphatase family metal-dependent hydrolase
MSDPADSRSAPSGRAVDAGETAARPPVELTVASFNVHAGIDGWGRPFDLVAGCRDLDADVLVLEEAWSPDGGVSQAEEVAAALGYPHVIDEPMARGRRGRPDPAATDKWVQPFGYRADRHALYLDGHLALPAKVAESTRFTEAEPGALNLAVLTRMPVARSEVIELGRRRGDLLRRIAIVVDLPVGGTRLVVLGVHMPHLTRGSPFQYRDLRRRALARVGDRPSVIVGDMNLWGPPVELLLGGWKRTVKGKTWPAWRPHSQVDHVLVRGPGLTVVSAGVAPAAGSDHRGVRARLRLG